ncbi:chloride channel protein [Singulisphaera acidiphila]|uniref:Chloride channel protein EriC n=1 Tax=Singulisphaera acidiphila (strain ATCC BAA-1392 / DSM 18658 / VKM B-2454 / MOB10) TaxID=886293 RepID=L0DJ01_SINAD|nr:chloride channel protein [Singulisphaera acidiphila]AGA28793.1 chloride channel protein EriC [Singulisphaera acidiphila DSM 18658]
MAESIPRGRAMVLLGRILNRLVSQWAIPGAGRVAVCSPLVGLIAGLGAVAFLRLLALLVHYVLNGLLHFYLPPTGEGVPHAITSPYPWWLVLLVPTLGGLLSGLIVFTWAPEAEGHGTDALIRAFHRGGGQIRGRVPLIKGIASVITIGTGGSAGQEGPIAQIGAGFGSFLARLLRLTPNERRLLMLAGAAGGVGAIFRAPLGGALFACEVLYMTAAMESAALLPCLASSIVAYSTFALFITPSPIFIVPNMAFRGLAELPMFALLALACAGVGWLYVRIFYGLRDYVFKPIPLPRHIKPALGGLLLGLIALIFPQVMTGGYGWVQWGAIGMPPSLLQPHELPFAPQMGVGMLLSLALLKTVTTGLTISSGGSGGVFGPSVFIGGMLGGAVGQLLHGLFPSWNLNPSAFALVGMGGFFAGVSKTPLTSIMMVSEMAGNYSLLVPLMLVCGLNMGLSRRWTLYEEQVPSPVDSPAHQGDFVIDVLEQLRVSQVMVRTEGLELVPAGTPFVEIVRRVAQSTETLFLVVDRQGALSGVFTLRDIRLALEGTEWAPLVVADDLAHRPVLTVTLADDLHTALKRLTELNVDEIPVVAPDDPGQLVGLLHRRELVAAYTTQIDALRSPDPASVL